MEPRRKPFQMKLVALTLAVALLGVVSGIALTTNLETATSAGAESLTALALNASTADQLESPFKAVYQDVSRSIVGIKLTVQTQAMRGRIQTDTQFVGSGVVIGEGYVVTNYHVVTADQSSGLPYGFSQQQAQQGDPTGIVVVSDGKEYPATYVAGDSDSDIAVLKVDGLTAPAARIGNSDELSIGDWALVIGNPLGEEFANTLTVGVISGQDRSINNKQSGSSMIQTNAQINSGNSGGGLFNIRGELVGITSMKLSSSGIFGYTGASIEGIGLAIPINTVSKIVDDLIEHGKVVYPRLGVVVESIINGSEEPTKTTLPNSVWVTQVETGSPAELAGIKVDDLIMEANGQRVYTAADLQAVLRLLNEGDTIQIKVYRVPNVRSLDPNADIPDGEYITVDVTVKILDA